MGTVAETLGFKPEVLCIPELDELNSGRGRIAMAQVARAELLSLAGYSSSAIEDHDQEFRIETQNIKAGRASRNLSDREASTRCGLPHFERSLQRVGN